MTHYIIENEELQVEILAKGAELTSIQAKSDNTEFLWQSDPAYWSRHAPILFPIVGKLKNDSYYYKGQRYDMTQHGFARDMDFYVVEQQAAKIRLVLDYSEETLRKYPFKFRLEVEYSLQNNQLLTRYLVTNLSDKEEMLFSVGAHPGFKVPLDDKTTFEDYRLELLPETNRTFIPVTEEVLLQTDQAAKAAQASFPLTRELFKDGVLIFETPGKTQVALKSDRTEKAIIMDYQTLPYLGIWSTYPADAPFVCLEPWNGVADIFDASGQLSEKLGVNQLEPQGQFVTEYTTTFINGASDE